MLLINGDESCKIVIVGCYDNLITAYSCLTIGVCLYTSLFHICTYLAETNVTMHRYNRRKLTHRGFIFNTNCTRLKKKRKKREKRNLTLLRLLLFQNFGNNRVAELLCYWVEGVSVYSRLVETHFQGFPRCTYCLEGSDLLGTRGRYTDHTCM